MPFTSFGITPISFADLLGIIESRVQTYLDGIIAKDLVFLSTANDEYHLKCPPADQFVVLFPESFPVWQSVVSGAGSSLLLSPGDENLGFDLSMRVGVFTRLISDQEFRASQLFRNVTLGIMGITNKVVACFQIWTAPTPDDSNISYLREPARIVTGPRITHRNYPVGFWSCLTMQVEMKFTLAVGG